MPTLFWYVGGTDPNAYRRPEPAGRVVQEVPTKPSSRFAPVSPARPRDRDPDPRHGEPRLSRSLTTGAQAGSA